ncbi:AtpZ/AtpI family protein [Aureisphaera galaxeae]|uniref:AtpZ/AtpI family protein n=1 Tax=Aureisphaera galaxeae TaxID=1538023 RepID=UPI002350CAC4|nr:AtpZ/AtpI family protein [Aureisphaera galaxeae]MDC8005055.1 AtpZ/AtpI family protein [Aureisphaera galaxeae]
MSKKNPKGLKNWAIFSGIGLQMGLIIYLGNLLGVWLDKKFETTFLEETITILAVFGAMFSVVYRINKFNANDK